MFEQLAPEVLASPDFRFMQKAYPVLFAAQHLSFKEFSIAFYSESREWTNIAEHAGAAGVYADILCDLLKVDGEVKDKVVTAALLHDAGKVFEILGFRNNPDPSPDEFRLIMKSTEDRLGKAGVSPEIIDLAGSSIPKEEEVKAMSSGQSDWMSLEQKIVWYVDAMLWGDKPVDVTQRMESAIGAEAGSARETRNKLIHQMYTYNGQPLHTVQIEIGKRIGQEFVDRLGLEITADVLPRYLENIQNWRVAKSDLNYELRQVSNGLRVDAQANGAEQFSQIVGRSALYIQLLIILNRQYKSIFNKPLPGVGDKIYDPGD